jgi:hypothetical protein
VEDNDKHQLEGLLQARSQDLRQGARRRGRRPIADPPYESPPLGSRQKEPVTRACAGCGDEITPRRLRALPRATHCLGCRRAAERAATPS